jgi:hypothetical protein
VSKKQDNVRNSMTEFEKLEKECIDKYSPSVNKQDVVKGKKKKKLFDSDSDDDDNYSDNKKEEEVFEEH